MCDHGCSCVDGGGGGCANELVQVCYFQHQHTVRHINASTNQRIISSTYQHINTSTHQHIHKHINTYTTRPQLNAVLVRMEKAATEQWNRQLPQHKKPGRGMWEVLDYGDVVVHIMTAEEREYYGTYMCAVTDACGVCVL